MQSQFVSLRVLGVLVVKQKLYHEDPPARRAGTKARLTGGQTRRTLKLALPRILIFRMRPIGTNDEV